MVVSTCLRLSTVSSLAVIFLNMIAVLLKANETYSHQADVLVEPVMHRICDPEVAGLIPGRGALCATIVGKLTFLATMRRFIKFV